MVLALVDRKLEGDALRAVLVRKRFNIRGDHDAVACAIRVTHRHEERARGTTWDAPHDEVVDDACQRGDLQHIGVLGLEELLRGQSGIGPVERADTRALYLCGERLSIRREVPRQVEMKRS